MDAASNPSGRFEPQDRGQLLATGRTWGGFELRALVGRGSFGEVYRTWDPRLQREIALKLLLPRPLGVEAQFEDLLREARALASVRHSNIVSIYGIDRHDGLVGYWTDFVHGKTLALLVREQGTFGHREAALIGIDVSKALSAVHRAGLLHRDIKAENVMREEGGRILLMDFGLSRMPHKRSEFAGTPHYMAPELFVGAAATVASDLYAVGMLLFYLVAGAFPAQQANGHAGLPLAGPEHVLSGEAVTSEVTQVSGGPASANRGLPGAGSSISRSVVDYRPDVPEGFARIIDTAIHPDPVKRFASAGALAAALSEVVAGPPGGNAPEKPPSAGPAGRRASIYGVALLLFLGAIGTVTYLRSGKGLLGTATSPSSSLNASGGLNEEYLKADALLLRYDRRKNVSDAIDLLNDVLKKDPSFALAQAGLCRADFLQYRVTRTTGLLDQARAACNRAIAIDGSLSPPYVTLARIDAMASNTALASQEVQKALRLDPRSAEAYGAQAEVLDAEGRSADAIAAAQRAMDLAPDYWRWPVLLGHYYFLGGKLPEAAEQFRKATVIAPDNSIAFLDLGLASLQLERYDDASDSLEKSAQIEPSFFAYSTLAELLTTQGKFAEAVEMSKKALDLDPTNYVAWGNLASAYLWSPGGQDKAMETYKKAIELAENSRKETPDDPELLARLGGYYAFNGQSDRSLKLLRQAVVLAPNNPNVLFVAGDGYEILHRRSDAIQLIAKSLALGFHADQFQRSPELASLREDSKFKQALLSEQAKHLLDKSYKTR
jgi:serine/threonine protein kinase/Flp pilus assembly protein TadD